MFGGQLLLGTLMIAGTVVFHVTILVYLAGLLKRLASIVEHLHTIVGTTFLIATTVFIIICIHTIEAWCWAALFFISWRIYRAQTSVVFFSSDIYYAGLR